MKQYNSFLGAFFSGDNGQGGYNAAYGKSALAKLAMPDLDEESRNAAIAGLARVDPANAMKFNQEQQKATLERQMAQARMFVAAPAAQRPALYAAILPGLKKDWKDAPDIYTKELDDMIKAWAGNSGQQAPAKVQEAQWFAKQIGLDPAKDPQGYAEFMRQAAGYGGKGGKMSISPNGIPYLPDERKYWDFDSKRWIYLDDGPMGDQNPPPQTGEFMGTPTTVQTDNEAPVDFNTLPASEQQALTMASDAARQGKPFHYTVRGGVVSNAQGQPSAPAVGGAPSVPPPNPNNPFAKKGYQMATAEQKAAFGIPPDVPAQIGPDGQVNVINLPKKDAPAGYRYAANGTLEFIPGGPADPANKTNAKDSTADEKSAKGYLDRMIAAEKELDGLINSGFKPNVRDFYTAGQGAAINWAASPDGQVWRQQQEDWVRAKLRRESGASIPPDEMDREIKTYFPQPGDSKEVIESKRRSRIMAQQQLKTMAGRANASPAQPPAGGQGKYSVGQVLVINGKRYQVTGGDMNDPDLKELK